MAETKRIEWVDVLKYICMIMVMVAHVEAGTDLWYAFYFPFFLKAFFFASGYVYKPKRKFGPFLYRKFRQLFVPWLVFSLFDILLAQIFSFQEHESLLTELKWNFLQISGSGLNGTGDVLWFIAALFVAFIPFYFFIRRYENSGMEENKKCAVAVIIALALSVLSTIYTNVMPTDIFPWNTATLPWHLEYLFIAMFYMVLGYLFRQGFEHKFDQHNSRKFRSVIFVLYLCMVFIPYAADTQMPLAADIAYSYACQFVGIACVVAISKAVRPNRYISYVGQNTLIYFALHGKLYSAIQSLLWKYEGEFYAAVLANTVASSVFALLFALLLSVLLIIPAYIINRWLPFLVGRVRCAERD